MANISLIKIIRLGVVVIIKVINKIFGIKPRNGGSPAKDKVLIMKLNLKGLNE